MAEENQSLVICEKSESEGRNPSTPIFQALKDREYDGKFKKGTSIHTVKVINVAQLAWRDQGIHSFIDILMISKNSFISMFRKSINK